MVESYFVEKRRKKTNEKLSRSYFLGKFSEFVKFRLFLDPKKSSFFKKSIWNGMAVKTYVFHKTSRTDVFHITHRDHETFTKFNYNHLQI